MRKQRLRISLGVFAHNEENNIGEALKSILAAKLINARIEKIVVVSSGSFDATNLIVREWRQKDKRIQLITQSERQGKASAVNVFLREAKSPIVVTMSADLRLSPQALEEICLPFFDPGVGMVGAHPIPKPVKDGLINEEVRLLWQLHHEISLIRPKCGEMVAFRNIIREIPQTASMDEATLEVLLKMLGYTVAYSPRAIVYNRGPRNAWEFMIQRRKIQAGHEWISDKYNYRVVTTMPSKVAAVILRHLTEHPADLRVMFRLVILEITARTLGYIDYYIFHSNPYKWQMIKR